MSISANGVLSENGANLALADINEKDSHELLKELGDDRFAVHPSSPFCCVQIKGSYLDYIAAPYPKKLT